MIKLLFGAGMGLMLLSANATTAGEHRTGKAGAHPGGGVTVGPTTGGRGGRGGTVVTGPQPLVRPAPNVAQQYNWGIPRPGNASSNFPTNVRDHRSVRK